MLSEVDLRQAWRRDVLQDEPEGRHEVLDQEGRYPVSRSPKRLGLRRLDVELLRLVFGEWLRGPDAYPDAHSYADGADADRPANQLA
jgi:hypothetical protein